MRLYMHHTAIAKMMNYETRRGASLQAFRYLCFTKTGGGSAKPVRMQAPTLGSVLAFHYICKYGKQKTVIY